MRPCPPQPGPEGFWWTRREERWTGLPVPEAGAHYQAPGLGCLWIRGLPPLKRERKEMDYPSQLIWLLQHPYRWEDFSLSYSFKIGCLRSIKPALLSSQTREDAPTLSLRYGHLRCWLFLRHLGQSSWGDWCLNPLHPALCLAHSWLSTNTCRREWKYTW